MLLDDFDYALPKKLIAQNPLKNRSDSKLLIINRKTQELSHHQFTDIIHHLDENSVLVLNNTKVIKSRLFCYRETGAKIECFFLNQLTNNSWEIMIKKKSRLKVNEILTIHKIYKVKIIKKLEKTVHIQLLDKVNGLDLLNKHGEIPLPPYIKSDNPNEFEDQYQTVFSDKPGAVAAPTAGLHFTKEILAQLKSKNIDIIYITLHVGLGTFNPIQTKHINEHKMHKENYEINTIEANKLNNAIKEKKQIVAVGTTVTRALESNIKNNAFHSGNFSTNLFITPKYKFKAIDAMITNFHLPKSSLLILICAFATKSLTLSAYNEAIQNSYRFFSFGDAMLIK